MSKNEEYESLIQDLFKVISTGFIYEYDIQKINSNSTNNLFEIVETHYLLLNKLFIREFYLNCLNKLLSRKIDKLNLSLCVLLINPNLTTAWSSRKKILSTENNSIQEEFQLNDLILTKNFKCEQVYQHRRWLIKLARKSNNRIISENLEGFLNNEFRLINTLSKRSKQNYYCWAHFIWLCQFFYNHEEMHISIDRFLEQKNIAYENPSDFSILNTRLYLLKLKDFNSYDLLIKELELIDDLIVRYPYYLTIWNYRKYFLLIFNEILREKFNRNSLLYDLNYLNLKLIDVTKVIYAKTTNFDGFNFLNLILLSEIISYREIKLVTLINNLSNYNLSDTTEIINEYSSNFIKFIKEFIK